MSDSWLSRVLAAARRPAALPAPVPSPPEEAALEYASTLLAEARSEVDRADNKAQILLAGAGIGGGALAGGLLARSWSPLELAASVQWLWWIGLAAGAGGIGLLGSVVYPRGSRRGAATGGSTVEYFGDAAEYGTDAELGAAIGRSAAARLELTVSQLRQVSLIVALKYRAVAGSMWLLVAALGCCGGAVLLDRLVR
ncbi:Pycsar system effector family protein [Streptomyces sp. NPDC059479]|uniref:Pycsar system effector family protein n=1 Tax=Streptomyces sp. NPDC059479 TaxID=3346848 RepID=UPI003695D42F